VDASTSERPAELAAGEPAIGSIYPNPFNPLATIRYSLNAASHVRLEVFDVSGRLIRGLVDEVQGPGEHSASWDGRNEQGRAAASGQYFVRFDASQQVLVRKVILLR
jgi:flagellar hook assembly protein FlgD